MRCRPIVSHQIISAINHNQIIKKLTSSSLTGPTPHPAAGSLHGCFVWQHTGKEHVAAQWGLMKVKNVTFSSSEPRGPWPNLPLYMQTGLHLPGWTQRGGCYVTENTLGGGALLASFWKCCHMYVFWPLLGSQSEALELYQTVCREENMMLTPSQCTLTPGKPTDEIQLRFFQ